MTRRKREGREAVREEVLLGASIFIPLTLSYWRFPYGTFLALFPKALFADIHSVPRSSHPVSSGR